MTMNKKIMTTLVLVMVVGVIGTAYAYHTSFFGVDCDQTSIHRVCGDLNNLNDRMTILESLVISESFLVFTPEVAQGDDTITMSGMIEHNGYDDYSDEMYIVSPNDIVYSYGSALRVYENGTIYIPDINPSRDFHPDAGDGYYEVIVDYHGDPYVFSGFNYTWTP